MEGIFMKNNILKKVIVGICVVVTVAGVILARKASATEIKCTDDTTTIIQQEEIEEYLWLKFDKAMNSLKFPNDKQMLRKANDYLLNM